VPHWLDQHLYGSLLRERGVAADVIPFAALDATRLAHALRTALDEPRYALAAAALGDEVRREDGAALATTLLEQAMGVTS
jgi:UDP:flavonoid glycosyltransferase YjiC (YdhE family)